MTKIFNSKLYFLLSIIHTFITFFTDKLFFNYTFSIKLVILKCVLFVILTLFYKLIFKIIKGFLEKDKRIIHNTLMFLLYFCIMCIFVIICYPGNFKNDEIRMFPAVKILGASSWYHVLTYYIYALYLMIIPLVGGMSLIQSFICSLIFIYVYDKSTNGKVKTKLSYILIIPFLFLPVIASNLYPYRPTMYAYFEVFFIFYLYYKYHNKENLNWNFFITVGIFTAILASFRSECIYYLICVPIGMILFFVKKQYIKKFIICLIITFLTYGVLYYDQNLHVDNINGYKTLTYVMPLSLMLKEGNLKGENLDKNIEILDKIFDIDALTKCASYKDVEPVWKCEALSFSNPDEDYDDALVAFLKIVKDNPISFVKSRIKTFIATSALDKNASNVIYDSSIMFHEGLNKKYVNYPKFGISYKFNKPFFPNRRANMIRFLEGRNIYDYFDYEITYPLFYNLIFPFAFIIIYILYNLFKKKWFNSMLFLLVFAKVPLIFMTATACYFMYYFSTYFICYILLFICIYNYLYNRKKAIKSI